MDDFDKYVADMKKEESRPKSGGKTGSYEEIFYSGLAKNETKIIRFVSGAPNSKKDDFCAKTIRVTMIVGDNGKKFRYIFPVKDDPKAVDHIMWKILNKVNEAEWIDNKKTFKTQSSHPEIFRMIAKNGYSPKTPQGLYDKGWAGQEVVVVNVIDREQMEWHKEHKQLMILSKNVNYTEDGRIFADTGVPAYGFLGPIAHNLFEFYGDWANYDVGVERLGLKENPYRVINANKHTEEVPEGKRQYVVDGPLTEEELSWKKINLNKVFGETKATKLYNRLKKKIANIDLNLGTNFLEELKELVDKETLEAEANVKEKEESKVEEKAGTMVPSSEEPKIDTPTVSTREVPARELVKSPPVDAVDISTLKGWDKMTQTEKENIKFADETTIEYFNSDSPAACPTCGAISDLELNLVCPRCGQEF